VKLGVVRLLKSGIRAVADLIGSVWRLSAGSEVRAGLSYAPSASVETVQRFKTSKVQGSKVMRYCSSRSTVTLGSHLSRNESESLESGNGAIS
jgi:hypothetical protein